MCILQCINFMSNNCISFIYKLNSQDLFHVDKKGFFKLSSVPLDFSWAQFSPNGTPLY